MATQILLDSVTAFLAIPGFCSAHSKFNISQNEILNTCCKALSTTNSYYSSCAWLFIHGIMAVAVSLCCCCWNWWHQVDCINVICIIIIIISMVPHRCQGLGGGCHWGHHINVTLMPWYTALLTLWWWQLWWRQWIHWRHYVIPSCSGGGDKCGMVIG